LRKIFINQPLWLKSAFPKLWSADPKGSVRHWRWSAGNYCFLVEFREKIYKLLYTVTSENLLLKSLLFLLINTSSEADYYIIIRMSFQQSVVKKTAWCSI